MISILTTKTYLRSLGLIEDFIYESNGKNITFVEKFIKQHEKVTLFIAKNPLIGHFDMMTKNQSWPFMNGRYRIFYLYLRDTEKIYLILLIIGCLIKNIFQIILRLILMPKKSLYN